MLKTLIPPSGLNVKIVKEWEAEVMGNVINQYMEAIYGFDLKIWDILKQNATGNREIQRVSDL